MKKYEYVENIELQENKERTEMMKPGIILIKT